MSEPHILIAADETDVIRQCERLLGRAGFRTTLATGQEQALTLLSGSPVDMILLDVRLPGLDTLHLLPNARRIRPGLPVLLLSGFGSLEAAVTLLQDGADSLVLKPIQDDELLRAVEKCRRNWEERRQQFSLYQLVPLFDLVECLHASRDPVHLAEQLVEDLVDKFSLTFAGVYEVWKEKSEGADRVNSVVWRGDPGLEDYLEQFSVMSSICAPGLSAAVRPDPLENAGLYAFLRERDLGWLLCAPLEGGNPRWILAATGCGPALEEIYFSVLTRLASGALALVRSTGELAKRVQQLERARQSVTATEKRDTAGRLASMIAHEMNNPLQALLSTVELAGRDGLDGVEQRRYLDRVQVQVDRLKCIVKRMQELYRPDTRDVQLTDINAPIRRVVELLQTQLQQGNILVHLDLHPRLVPILLAPGQIEQVLLNLLMNSLEAMPKGGELWVATNPVEAEGARSGVEIMIEDSGPGVPETVRATLFEPFVSTKEGGTGLGLAASYGIILAHGGTLDLVERRNRGACFRIQFLQGEEE